MNKTLDEQQAFRAALAKLPQWRELSEDQAAAWNVSPGSDLANDDKTTHPYLLSAYAKACVTGAVSHLATFADSAGFTQDSEKIVFHTTGQYSLVRGAIENACSAIWLLEPDESGLRIERRLQTDMEEFSQENRLSEILSGVSTPDRVEQHKSELRRIARSNGVPHSRIAPRKRDSWEKLLVKAGRVVLPGQQGEILYPLIWKACSSLAHCDMRGLQTWSKKVPVGPSINGVTMHAITSNTELLAFAALLASEAIEVAIDVYQVRAGAGGSTTIRRAPLPQIR